MDAAASLDRLRKAVEIGTRPEEQEYLRITEHRIKMLKDYEGLAQRPAIRDLLDYFKRDIRTINERLSTDRDFQTDRHTAERLAMLERKDVLLYLVGLFDPHEELDALAKELTERAINFEQYHGTGEG